MAASGCVFGPAHPRTWVYGAVQSTESLQRVKGATIALYGTKVVTSEEGCFKLQLSSALPLTFKATATGFKVAESSAKFGFYSAVVTLAPEASAQASTIVWYKASESEILNAPGCKDV